MSRVIYQGRSVCKRWYKKYVLKTLPKPEIRHRKEPVLALFYMPENLWAPEPAETRLMNLASRLDVKWIIDMSECYAIGQSKRLTTFFPALENTQVTNTGA